MSKPTLTVRILINVVYIYPRGAKEPLRILPSKTDGMLLVIAENDGEPPKTTLMTPLSVKKWYGLSRDQFLDINKLLW